MTNANDSSSNLTKLEYFSIEILQAIITRDSPLMVNGRIVNPEDYSKFSINQATDLINALNNQ
jgi:hypothetical protein